MKKVTITARQVRFHFPTKTDGNRKRHIHERFADSIEVDPIQGFLRIGLKQNGIVRIPVNLFNNRPSRSQQGMHRVTFWADLERTDKLTELTLECGGMRKRLKKIDLLLTGDELFEFVTSTTQAPAYTGHNKTSTFDQLMKVINKTLGVTANQEAVNRLIYGTSYSVNGVVVPNDQVRADRIGNGVRVRIRMPTEQKPVKPFSEDWRYNGCSGWKKRRIRNGRARTGNYILVGGIGETGDFEYETRHGAKLAAETIVKTIAASPNVTVCYVSYGVDRVQGGIRTIEREASRRD